MVSSTAVLSTSGAPDDQIQPLLEALKAIATALKSDEVPFALAGSYAVYARGGARSLHDVDFVVQADAVQRAKDSLAAHGFRVEQPPEDWLFKAYQGDVFIDLIHTLASGPVTGDLLKRCDELRVESVIMPVLGATDMLTSKLLALSEHSCDLESSLAVVRSLREQLDVPQLLEATRGHVFAETALFLFRKLGLLDGLEELR